MNSQTLRHNGKQVLGGAIAIALTVPFWLSVAVISGNLERDPLANRGSHLRDGRPVSEPNNIPPGSLDITTPLARPGSPEHDQKASRGGRSRVPAAW